MNRYEISLDEDSVSDLRATYSVYDRETGTQLPSVTVLNGGDYSSTMGFGSTGFEVYADPNQPRDLTHKFSVSPPLREQAEVLTSIGKFSAFLADLR